MPPRRAWLGTRQLTEFRTTHCVKLPAAELMRSAILADIVHRFAPVAQCRPAPRCAAARGAAAGRGSRAHREYRAQRPRLPWCLGRWRYAPPPATHHFAHTARPARGCVPAAARARSPSIFFILGGRAPFFPPPVQPTGLEARGGVAGSGADCLGTPGGASGNASSRKLATAFENARAQLPAC